MANDVTGEFHVLIDRYLAGDTRASDLHRLRQLCEANESFHAEFQRVLKLESLLASTFGSVVSGEISNCEFEAEEPESVQDASIVDLYSAGMLSQEDIAQLRLDMDEDPCLSDEVRDADILSELLFDTLCKSAGESPTQAFVGAERVDRYLAGDLDTEEIAGLFVDAIEDSNLDAELSHARAFELLMRDGLGAIADQHLVPADFESDSSASIANCEESLDRYLAGELSSKELLELEAAAASMPAIASRLALTRQYEDMMHSFFTEFRTSVPKAPGRKEISLRKPTTAPASRRMRARAFLKSRRSRRRRQAAVVASSLVAMLMVALLVALWPRGEDPSHKAPAIASQDALNDAIEEESPPSKANATPAPENIDEGANEEPDKTPTSEETETQPIRVMFPEPNEEAIPEQTDPSESEEGENPAPEIDEKIDHPEKPLKSDPKGAGSEVKKDDNGGRTAPAVKKINWYDQLQFTFDGELIDVRNHALNSGQLNLSPFFQDDGALDLGAFFKKATTELEKKGSKPSYGSRYGKRSKLKRLSGTYAIILRALLKVKTKTQTWKSVRKELRPSFDAVLARWRQDVQNNVATMWDNAEMLVLIELWHRSNESGSKRIRLKSKLRKEIVQALRMIRESQQESGLWGESSTSAYGSVGDTSTLAHWVGRELTYDLFNTYAALRGVEAATKALGSQGPDSLYENLARGLLSVQSTNGLDREVVRVFRDKTDKLVTRKEQSTARGWTLTGFTENAETGRPLMRTGAMTAAALAMLKTCQLHLSDAQEARVEGQLGPIKNSFADAERDAISWLDRYHRNKTNPAANGEHSLAGYDNFRYYYLIALKHATSLSGDLALKQKSVAMLVHESATAEYIEDPLMKWGTRETLTMGAINPPIRRAYSILALTGE